MTKPDYCPVAQEPCQLMCVISDVRCKIRDAAQPAPVQEPVATLWQHGETGRTRITMPGDITDCDARWFKAADLYTTPPAAPVQEPVAVVGEDKHGPFVDWLGDRSSFYERNPVGTKFYTTPPKQPAPVQEPEYWNVLDPTGNVVASETDAIRGWARIAGSYKPTVEGLLGFHDQGWRVLPKITPPAQLAVPDAIGPNEDELPAYAAGWNDCRQAMLEMMK